MKIVFGTDLFYQNTSGGLIHLLYAAKSLVELGHEVKIIHGRQNNCPVRGYEEMDGVTIYHTTSSYKFGAMVSALPVMTEMKRILDNMIRLNEVDVCIPVQYRPLIPFYLASRNKIPCVSLWHHTSLKGKFQGLEEWMKYEGGRFKGFLGWIEESIMIRLGYEGVFTVSESSKKELSKYMHSHKIYVVGNGVDISKIDPVKASERKNQAVFIGRLVKHKNILEAINSVIQARQKIKDLELIIITQGGSQESEVIRFSQKFDFINYYKDGSDKEKIKLLKESKVLLHPGSREGFGLVLIEALVCKTPFLSYSIPTMEEIARKTKGGITVPYKNTNLLAEKLCNLIQDQELIEKMGERGRQYVEQNYTWNKVAKKYEVYLENIIKGYSYPR